MRQFYSTQRLELALWPQPQHAGAGDGVGAGWPSGRRGLGLALTSFPAPAGDAVISFPCSHL